jgi:hypothetical protein
MHLLSLKEIQTRLLELSRAFGGGIPELNMKASMLTGIELDELGVGLDVRLSESFRKVLLLYDFGELNVGNVWFGQRGDYIEFLEFSNGPDVFPPWWSQGIRPKDRILVAATDGYIILLNTADGGVAAYLRSEDWSANRRIADTFELLVRGAGTVYFGRQETDDQRALGKEVAMLCGADTSSRFWQDLAQGIT